MITRSITRPVTSPIARAVTGAYGAVWNPRALFSSGEQGVIYDPNDLATLWQDSAGTTPVTAAGQPVGLMLDKRLGLVRGIELVANGDFNDPSGWTISDGFSISGGNLNYTAGTGRDASSVIQTTSGRWYSIEYTVPSTSVAVAVYTTESANLAAAVYSAATGKRTAIFLATGASATIRIRTAYALGSFVMSDISVRELPGNHASQPTASAKPFVRDTPRRIDYDADDSQGITFPVSLGAACTVARSIPGVGAQILTAQTIGTSFTDSVDNCGLIIINRALNAAETASLTRYLNQRAGV